MLVHLLPGLALFAHRFLSHTAQPLQLARDMLAAAAAAAGGATATATADNSHGADSSSSGVSSMSAAAFSMAGWIEGMAAVATGRVPCPGDTAAYSGGGSGAGVIRGGGPVHRCRCYAGPVGPAAAPAPAVVWLVAAPLGFYAVWQLGYFLLVQVVFRRVIVEGGYDTSYRWEREGEGEGGNQQSLFVGYR